MINLHTGWSFEFIIFACIANLLSISSVVRSSTGAASANVETWPKSSTLANNANRPSQRMSLITNNQQNLLKSHQDVVTALACIDSPFKGGIVSGDRAGVIKVWRIDGYDH